MGHFLRCEAVTELDSLHDLFDALDHQMAALFVRTEELLNDTGGETGRVNVVQMPDRLLHNYLAQDSQRSNSQDWI